MDVCSFQKKDSMTKELTLTQQEIIENKIYLIRGHKVMLDKDLAGLYGVTTGNLNKAVKRNMDRFPQDFMFQLNETEINSSSFHIGSLKRGYNIKYLPYVFTEQGIAMLSSVLKSKKAVQVNIQIMRTFAKIRELMMVHKDLRQRIGELEKKYDSQFKIVFDALRKLIDPPVKKPKIPFGFAPPVQK